MYGFWTVAQHSSPDFFAEYREIKIQLHLRDEILVPQSVPKGGFPVGMNRDIPTVITGTDAAMTVPIVPMVEIGVERDTKFCASYDACIGELDGSGLFNSVIRAGIDLKGDGDMLALPGT